MAYVPGFRNDVFISYAHGDDAPALSSDGRGWVSYFHERLQTAVQQRVGFPVSVWMDRRNLQSYVDFDSEIHNQLDAAILILIMSPSYTNSHYCKRERDSFLELVGNKHKPKFCTGDLANSQFIFKVVSLSDADASHRRILQQYHLSDEVFFDNEGENSRRLMPDSPRFGDALYKLERQVASLLRKMRAQCFGVFIWPPAPSALSGLKETHSKLCAELADASYRVLPESADDPKNQLEGAELSVFMLGPDYDKDSEILVNHASTLDKAWVIWRSAAAQVSADERQKRLLENLLDQKQKQKVFLDEKCSLKDEVLALLKRAPSPEPWAIRQKRVYVIYNKDDPDDRANAAYVLRTVRSEFEVAVPADFSQHRQNLTLSDGVLLVWGTAKREWYTLNLEDMSRVVKRGRAEGICLFDPRDAKESDLSTLRNFADLHVIEQFERYDPARLQPFLNSLRGRAAAAQ
ncbi:MAG TPA: toll/interleukin-1 receptor domain-containing protein [Bryobacteraceae bacterium]|nr:toll/interleukin-1 receptor domain-containing protein [Bryobacteraceae bacterium]